MFFQPCAKVDLVQRFFGSTVTTDFCNVSADLLQSVLDARVKRSSELSTNHHLVVSNLRLENQQGLHERAGLEVPANKVRGGQKCKEDICRQCIVLVPRVLMMRRCL